MGTVQLHFGGVTFNTNLLVRNGYTYSFGRWLAQIIVSSASSSNYLTTLKVGAMAVETSMSLISKRKLIRIDSTLYLCRRPSHVITTRPSLPKLCLELRPTG